MDIVWIKSILNKEQDKNVRHDGFPKSSLEIGVLLKIHLSSKRFCSFGSDLEKKALLRLPQ